jgi:hypothetical protein
VCEMFIFRLKAIHMEGQDVESMPSRPPLLLILAVMTVLMSLFTIGGGLFFSEDFSGWGEGMPQSPAWVTTLTIVSALVKLGGAAGLLLMRRGGFYAYLTGELMALSLNLKTGFDLMRWSAEARGSGMTVNPELFAVILVGLMIVFSVIWVGGFATYLERLR